MLLLHGGGAVTGMADQETKSADAITGKYWRVLSRPLLKAGYRRAISAVCPLSVCGAYIHPARYVIATQSDASW